jgi:hypothetical protein
MLNFGWTTLYERNLAIGTLRSKLLREFPELLYTQNRLRCATFYSSYHFLKRKQLCGG